MLGTFHLDEVGLSGDRGNRRNRLSQIGEIPDSSLVIANSHSHTLAPVSVDKQDARVKSVHVAEVLVSYDDAAAIGDCFHDFDEGVKIRGSLVVNSLDEPAEFRTIKSERPSSLAAVYTRVLECDSVVASLLVGQVVERCAGNRDIAVGGNVVSLLQR
jgi:hypothetical protein